MFMGMNRLSRISDNRLKRVPHVHGDEPEIGGSSMISDAEFPIFMGMNRLVFYGRRDVDSEFPIFMGMNRCS